MDKKDNVSVNYFNFHDLEVMDNVKEVLEVTPSIDETLKEKFSSLNHKLHSTYNINKVLSEYKEIEASIQSNDRKMKEISNAIKNKKVLSIVHTGTDGVLTKREIIPITFFEFENVIYITAFCKLRGDIRQFPLNRITSIETL